MRWYHDDAASEKLPSAWAPFLYTDCGPGRDAALTPPSEDDMRERLEEHLRREEPSYFELLRHMVRINSFTAHRDGVNALAELTAVSFEKLGFSAESVPPDNPEYGDHLVLTRPGRDPSGPRIALVSHLDTVYSPAEEARHGFVWREDGDRIYGPGTVDIKGGTVVAYMTLDALRAAAPEALDAATWTVMLNSAEERVSDDFGALCRDRLGGGDTLAALVFEGGLMDAESCKTVVARKGMAVFRVTADGRAAHAGNGHGQGANALVQMAEAILRLHALTDYERGLTVNVGTAAGGTVINQVPPSAVAEAEMRAFSEDVYERGLRAVLALDGFSSVRSSADGYPCTVRVEVVSRTPPWPRNPASDRLFGIWREEAAKLGIGMAAEERGGLSDANHFWDLVPTLDGLGPSGANAHCPEHSADGSKEQEYATRSTFVPKALLNALAVLRLLEQR